MLPHKRIKKSRALPGFFHLTFHSIHSPSHLLEEIFIKIPTSDFAEKNKLKNDVDKKR
jgi:hypothetical protein